MARGALAVVRALANGHENVESITVCGRPAFRRAVREALMLLRERKVPAWATLTKNVSWIFQGGRSFIIVTAHPAFIFINNADTAQQAHLAGTLAHMACSCQLHRDFEARVPGRRVPREEYSGAAAQDRCMKVYRECVDALTGTSASPEHRPTG